MQLNLIDHQLETSLRDLGMGIIGFLSSWLSCLPVSKIMKEMFAFIFSFWWIDMCFMKKLEINKLNWCFKPLKRKSNDST